MESDRECRIFSAFSGGIRDRWWYLLVLSTRGSLQALQRRLSPFEFAPARRVLTVMWDYRCQHLHRLWERDCCGWFVELILCWRVHGRPVQRIGRYPWQLLSEPREEGVVSNWVGNQICQQEHHQFDYRLSVLWQSFCRDCESLMIVKIAAMKKMVSVVESKQWRCLVWLDSHFVASHFVASRYLPLVVAASHSLFVASFRWDDGYSE